MSKQRKPAPTAAKLAPGTKLYVVQRKSWRASGDHLLREEGDGGHPVRAFVGRKSAEALCEELERAARRQLSPFRFVNADLELAVKQGKMGFRAGLKKLGVPLPPAKILKVEDLFAPCWQEWWDSIVPDLTE